MFYRHYSSTLLWERVIRTVQLNQDGLKLNGTHQLLVYADVVVTLDGSIHTRTRKKSTEDLAVASQEFGLDAMLRIQGICSCLKIRMQRTITT
jgi:hypothetical protein